MGAPFHTLKANFNGGEMTPLMAARYDTDKLPNACLTLKNLLVRTHGGVFKRPGTQYAGSVKNSANATRLIPFRRSTQTNYVLELGDYYMRFWKGGSTPTQVTVSGVSAWQASTAYAVGALVSSGGVNYYCTTAHTSGSSFSAGSNWYALTGSIYEIPTPWAKADIFSLQYCQINDILFFTHPSYQPYRLSRYAETNCVIDLVPFTFAPSLDVNTTRTSVQVQYNVSAWASGVAYTVGQQVLSKQTVGSGTNVVSTYTEVYTCTVNHTSGSSTQPDDGSSWASYWNLGTSSQIAAAWANGTSYSVGNFAKNNNVTYKCTANNTGSTTVNQPGVGSQWASYWTIYSGDFDNGNLTYSLVSTDAAFSSADVGNTWLIQVGTQNYYRNISLVTSPPVATSKGVFIEGDMLVTSNWTAGDSPIGAIYLESSTDMTTWTRVREWDLAAPSDGNISHDETSPETGAYWRIGGSLTTSAGSGTIFRIDPVDNRLTVPFVITGYVSPTQVTGYVVMPGNQRMPSEMVGVYTTLYYKPAFSATSGYPCTVAFHDGRLWFAGTSSNPGRLWASESDNFYSFLEGTLATSAIDVTLGATESNQIRWIKSAAKRLAIGTTGEEWTIDSGDTDVPLTSTNIRARRRTNFGSSGPPAELIVDAMLWVARGGRRVHEFSYQFATDSFVAPDMTVMAEHITQGGIVQTAFQASPDPILWCVMGNGALAGFSYCREQNITAWHRHLTGEDAGDAFESVASIYGANVSDEIWFVVRRTINGSTVRYVERFDPSVFQWNTEQGDSMDGRAWVDCAIPGALGSTVVNSGGNCSINGFTALNGRSVRMLAGTASPASTAAVSAGAASFASFTAGGTTPIIGLPIISVIEPMPMDIQLQDGTGQGRHWRPNRVQFILNQAAGGQFADNPAGPFDNLVYPSGSAVPFTGRVREHISSTWAEEITFTIQHSDPLPFGMLAYVIMGEVSGE